MHYVCTRLPASHCCVYDLELLLTRVLSIVSLPGQSTEFVFYEQESKVTESSQGQLSCCS